MSTDELADAIRRLYGEMGERLTNDWQRDLPFDETLFDRWDRARRLGFGEGASVYHNCYVFGNVSVGERTWVGPMTMLDGSGGIRIGRNCSISTGVQIYSHDSVRWALSGGACDYDHSPVVIGDCCYIGSQTVIERGVTIGDHVLVGACSFVNRDLPSRAIAVGSPCRIIGRVVGDGRSVRFEFNEPRTNQPSTDPSVC